MKNLALALVFVAVLAPAQLTQDGVKRVAKYILNHENIEAEYFNMAIELRELKNSKVDKLMTPHMEKIVKLMQKPESDLNGLDKIPVD